jgi:hypothetical protein
MQEILGSETLWLNITNAALGLATLICLGVFIYGVVQEIHVRVGQRVRVPLANDTHSFVLEELGVTMADGGEPVDETAVVRIGGDPPNVVRSEN